MFKQLKSSPSRRLVVVALLAYSAVMISLTMLKSFYRIGYLWDPEEQRRRGISLQVMGEFARGETWFGPLFGYLGNVAFFVPFGVLLYVLIKQSRVVRDTAGSTVLWTLLGSLVLSLAMETAQYVFSLGLSDIDDLVTNTLGALIGGLIAMAADELFGIRFRWVWVLLALALGVVFAVLVGLGERLGDPDKVVEV